MSPMIRAPDAASGIHRPLSAQRQGTPAARARKMRAARFATWIFVSLMAPTTMHRTPEKGNAYFTFCASPQLGPTARSTRDGTRSFRAPSMIDWTALAASMLG